MYGDNTFDKLEERLGSRDSRKVGNNTYLQRRDADTLAVRLHATDVVTYRRDGSVTLNSGGWLTVTTKDRLNTWAPVPRVSSVRGRWFVGDVAYFDGITFNASGDVTNPEDGPDVAGEDAANRSMRRKIAAYVALYTDERIAELLADAQANGTAGDCFYCQFRTVEDGTPVGDSFGDHDHLRSHLEESYVMASLALNAIKASGYRDPVLILNIAPDLTRRAIGKYLRKRLLAGVAVTV